MAMYLQGDTCAVSTFDAMEKKIGERSCYSPNGFGDVPSQLTEKVQLYNFLDGAADIQVWIL